jgi:hypothetical protein
MNPDPFSGTVTGNWWNYIYARNCLNQVVDYSGYGYNWLTENSGIATLDDIGFSEGISPGSTYFQASIEVPVGLHTCQYVENLVSATGTVSVPDRIAVSSDTTGTLSCAGSPKERTIKYVVLNASGNTMTVTPIVREQFQNLSFNSCGSSIVFTSQSCTVSNALGVFTDVLTTGCVQNGATQCGFTATQQQWQWCAPNGDRPSIGTPGALDVKNTSVSVGGNMLGFTLGYQPPK